MADVDTRPNWWMGIFLVCYTTFLICLVIGHPGYGAIILGLELALGDRIYGAVKLKAIKIGTEATWWRIWFLEKPTREFDKERSLGVDDENEAGEYVAYELDGQPELITASHEEVARVFENNDTLKAMYAELNKRMTTTYSTNHASKVVTQVLDPNQVMHDLALSPHQVNLDDYELEYFRERRLSAHITRRAYTYIRKHGINLERFLSLSKHDMDQLQVDIHNHAKENVDLNRIQRYLRHEFSVFFKPAEIEFFKKRGCKTLGDLARSNLEQLEREFNARYAKARALARFKEAIEHVPVAKYVRELQDEIAGSLSKIVHSLSSLDYADYIRMQEIALLEANPGSFFYRVKLKNPVAVPIKEGDDTIATIDSKCITVELPALHEDAVHDEECTMYPLGIPVKVQTSSTLQLVFRDMLVWDRPIYYAADCSYWREHAKSKSPVDKDQWYENCVKAMSRELYDASGEVRKSMTLFESSQSTIETQHSTINNQRALTLDQENVAEVVERTKAKIAKRLAPKGSEIPIFWVFTVIALIAGIFIGLFVGLTLQSITPPPGGIG